MAPRKAWISGLLGVALVTTTARAQVPPPPGPVSPPAGIAAAATGGGPSAVAVASPAAAPRTLFSFFGISAENCAKCRDKLCQSQLGLLLNNAMGPVSAISGGIIPPICPPVLNAEQMAALAAKSGPNGAEAVAAKIKADEADAKARVAAIEYLGTVDCRHWKEAEIAIMNALRADRNECVRFAAARVLNSGCCCSKEIVKVLKITVAGETSDGFPAELSPRVKGAAFSALQNCLMNFPDVIPPEPPKVDPPPPPLEREPGSPAPLPIPLTPEPMTREGAPATYLAAGHSVPRQPLSYQERLQQESLAQVVNEARSTLAAISQSARPPAILLTGKRSVYHSMIKARQDLTTGSQPPRGAGRVGQGNGAGMQDGGSGVVPTSFAPTTGGPGTGTPPTIQTGTQFRGQDAEMTPTEKKGGLSGVFLKTWKQRHPGS